MRLLPLLFLLLASCAGPGPCNVLQVDYSARRAVLGTKVFPVAVSARGVGGKPGSHRTPLGTFTISQKTTRHRFGPILRLSGESVDGYRQDGRGVLAHKRFGDSTHGCIAFYYPDLCYVYQHLDVGDIIQIKL